MVDQIIVDQLTVLKAALPAVQTFPVDWSDTDEDDYKAIYREGVLLTRSADAAAVERFVAELLDATPLDPDADEDDEAIRQIRDSGVVPEGRYLAEHLTAGLHRIWFRSPGDEDPRRRAPELLAVVERRLGSRIADLDYAFHTAGKACAADEPHDVPDGTFDPFPVAARGRAGLTPADGCNVLVSIVDTGFIDDAARQHWWLRGVTGDPDVIAGNVIKYQQGHGTFVAGCLRSTAPKAQVYVEGMVMNAGTAFESDIVVQLAEGLLRGPDVVVLSFTTATRDDLSPIGFDALYENVIRQRKGLAFLCPAGNDGQRGVMWPAAYPWVVSVGALSTTWQTKATFSNYGGWVDVFAPGEDLVNAFATGTYTCVEDPNKGDIRTFNGIARWSGTSFATPLVAGMIAARMSATGENGSQAADYLLRLARSQAIPGLGAVLYPDQALAEL